MGGWHRAFACGDGFKCAASLVDCATAARRRAIRTCRAFRLEIVDKKPKLICAGVDVFLIFVLPDLSHLVKMPTLVG